MLETALSTKYVPGTNLQDDLAWADWRFLLPTLRLDNILCIGTPPLAMLRALSRLSARICVISFDEREAHDLLGDSATRWDNVSVCHIPTLSDIPFRRQSIDLAFFAEQKSFSMLNSSAEVNELYRILKPGGTVYFEIQGLAARLMSRRRLRLLLDRRHVVVDRFWLMPFSGRMRSAIPCAHRMAASYLFSNVFYGQSSKKRALSRLGRGLSELGLIEHFAPRLSFVVRPARSNEQSMKLPVYLENLGHDAGIDLSRYSYSVSTRSQYNSNKVIFFLFDRNAREPSIVIKVTRSPEFNGRLRNEYHRLTQLRENALIDLGSIPEPLFAGYHNDLALLGQAAISGRPFRVLTQARPDCPIARKAIDWIIQLGVASVNKGITNSADVSASLNKLFESFFAIYGLGEENKDFLTQQIAFHGHLQRDFPLVFQHGDPGTWNILVSNQGEVIFIDWESGELHGMPLWDLFYFFTTYGSWMARMQGERDSLKSFAQHFLQPSPLRTLLRDATMHYCSLVGLDTKMIVPIFYTCWMHRALKESMRLSGELMESGHYVKLLRLVIENRRSVERVFT